MKNPIKAQVKAALLTQFDAETVRKGLARLERWQRAAYGAVDYETHVQESGLEGVTSTGAIYCREVLSGAERTFNRDTFGIYGTGRKRSEAHDQDASGEVVKSKARVCAVHGGTDCDCEGNV